MNDSQNGADVRQHVAAEVRAELARRRMSLRQASSRLGWGLTATHRRITGQSPLDVAHLHQIAEMLDKRVEEFFPPRRPERVGRRIDHKSAFLAMAS